MQVLRRENRVRSVVSADVFASCLTLVCYLCHLLNFWRKVRNCWQFNTWQKIFKTCSDSEWFKWKWKLYSVTTAIVKWYNNYFKKNFVLIIVWWPLCTYQCKAGRGGGGGRAWSRDLIVFTVVPGVGHLTDLVLPGEGIFESFFARRGDIWLPTRTKKTETEHMFPASTLHACAIRFEKIRKP